MSSSPPPLAELDEVSKTFGENLVLDRVSFMVGAGEVHALAGENGAGKSTLIKVLSGVHTDYRGILRIRGEARRLAGPNEALRHGIATIHQELSLVASMSVTDNLFLGRERRRFGLVAKAEERREARKILTQLGLDLDVDRPLGSYPISIQQMIEIARAIAAEARILIMDEPTSALTDPEVTRLFERVRDLRNRGAGIVYITHKMKEIYRIADRITVLRDGAIVGSRAPGALPRDELIRWMVGRGLRDVFPDWLHERGEVLLRARGLSVADRTGLHLVDNVSFDLHAGEILGLAGLQGSGNSRILHALFGDPGGQLRGTIEIQGAPANLRDPRAAMRQSLALVTNDRQRTGLVPTLSVTENATLASLERFVHFGRLHPARERAATAQAAARLRLVTPSLDAPVGALSGGNQQKVVLAKWLLRSPRVLLLDEPTRGVDVGAKADVYRLIRTHVTDGGAVLLITSEMEELLGLCDHILVLHRGRVRAELDRRTATQEAILRAAMDEPERATG